MTNPENTPSGPRNAARAPSVPFGTPDDMRETLMRAALVISAFRWRLRAAGYPFREPHDVARVMADIDAICDPATPPGRKLGSKNGNSQP